MSEDDKDKPSNIISLAEASGDGGLWTVEQMLLDAVNDIRSGERPHNKALLLLVDTTEGQFRVGFSNSGLKCSEMIAVTSCFTAEMMAVMGYGTGNVYGD